MHYFHQIFSNLKSKFESIFKHADNLQVG